MSGYIQDPLDIEVEPPSTNIINGTNEWPRAQYGKEEKIIGYSVGKWSDDDDWKGPFIPFLGAIK